MKGLRIFSFHSNISTSSITIVLAASWKHWRLFCGNPTILFNFENQSWRQLHAICTNCHCKSGPPCVLCGSMDSDCHYPSHLQSLFGVKGEEDCCHDFSHLLFSLSLAWNWVHLMLPLHESAEIHLYPPGASIPVAPITYTQSITLHHPIWHEKFDTNQMSFLTKFTSSLPFLAHKAQIHAQEDHPEASINQGGLNVFFSCYMRCGQAHIPTAFFISNNIGCGCPMKQKMHSCFKVL